MLVEYSSPKDENWNVTFHHSDPNPYGGEILYKLLGKSWLEQFDYSYQTLYERKGLEGTDYLILCNYLELDKEDISVLFEKANNGGSVLLVAKNFNQALLDTLGVDMFTKKEVPNPIFFQDIDTTAIVPNDGHNNMHIEEFPYPFFMLEAYFTDISCEVDTLLASKKGYPVMLRKKVGKGNIYMCSVPLIFSNISLASADNRYLVEYCLSYLSQSKLHWLQYYMLGRMESGSIFRYLLKQESLKWALYLSIVILMLFFVFGSKRKQRPIPIIVPLKNDTLLFVKHIARIFLEKGDHTSIARKRLLLISEKLRNQYRIDIKFSDKESISAKTGIDLSKASALKYYAKKMYDGGCFDEKELAQLSGIIEEIK